MMCFLYGAFMNVLVVLYSIYRSFISKRLKHHYELFEYETYIWIIFYIILILIFAEVGARIKYEVN